MIRIQAINDGNNQYYARYKRGSQLFWKYVQRINYYFDGYNYTNLVFQTPNQARDAAYQCIQEEKLKEAQDKIFSTQKGQIAAEWKIPD